MPLFVLSKSCISSSSSNSLIVEESAGCETNNLLAASLNDPEFAVAITYFNCKKVIYTPPNTSHSLK